MPAVSKCARCNSELPLDAPGGNCPACLVQLASDLPEAELGLLAPGRLVGQPARGNADTYFGDYKLQGEIARGGMGVVFRARQLSLNRPVALKMILAGQLASPVQVQRFYLEAEAAAKLDHPNIVPIYEVGIYEGQHFYSMKLIEGGNLAQHLVASSGRLEEQAAVQLIARVARAVHYAHQHQVLHRDLKPTNILLDAEGVPHVTDFGLAKIVADDPQVTGSLAVLGTPSYMAPEQALGRAGEVTTAADLYSLGSILFTLLVGRPPFQGATALETLRQVTEQEAPSLSKFLPAVDKDLETMCLKCLQRDPNARYASCMALAEELDRWLANEPILARPVGQPERIRRWARRNRATAALLVLFLFSLVAVAIGSAFAALRIQKAQKLATEELYESYLAQARALRLSGRQGQRSEAILAVTKAAAIHASPEARTEAIGALALSDLRFLPSHQNVDSTLECYDPELKVSARSFPDGTIVVRDCETRAELATLRNDGDAVELLFDLSPKGRYLPARYSSLGSILWDLHDRQPAIKDPAGWSAVDFAPDATMFVVSCDDGRIKRFDLDAARCVSTLSRPEAFSVLRLRPQANELAGVDREGFQVELLEMTQGVARKSLSHPSRVTMLAWSPDGALLATACENGRLFVWDAVTGEKQRELEGHQDYIQRLQFSHSGSRLASGSWEEEFRLWDTDTGQCLVTAQGYFCSRLYFSTEDRSVGYVQRERETGLLGIESSETFSLLTSPRASTRGAWSLDLSPDGELVAAALSDEVRIWARSDPRRSWSLPGGCRSALFTRDGLGLVTCASGLLARWPIHQLRNQATNQVCFGPREDISRGPDFSSAALSPDGQRVAAANIGAGAVWVYDIRQPTNPCARISHLATAFPAISSDGKWIASGTWKGSGVRVWEAASGRIVRDLATSESARVCFSPDNRWMVTGGTNYVVWEVGSWRRRYALPRANAADSIGSIAFSPDGKILALVRSRASIELLLASTGERLARLEAPRSSNLYDLRFDPDGRRLFALEWDQQVQVWNLTRLRSELRKLGLDWDLPPVPDGLSPREAQTPLPLQLSVIADAAR